MARPRVHPLHAVLTFVLCACAATAFATSGPYEHLWQAQGEVGGDRSGRFALTVLGDSMSMESVAGGYRGSLSYADRLTVQDASGAILVQVSDIRVALVGAPASGGTALGGTFNGTAVLTYYTVGSFADGAGGKLPPTPSGTATYDVTGHWGARMAGSIARGEIEFGSAYPRSITGKAAERDVGWFGPSDQSAQRFTVEVVGAVSASDGGGPGAASASSGTSVLHYIRRGLAGSWASPLPIPAELAGAARALRDARPVGAVALPANTIAIDVDIAGHTLDAKNVAAKTTAGSDAGVRAAAIWAAERTRCGDRVPMSGMAREIDGMLAARAETGGAPELRAQIGALASSSAGNPYLTKARVAEWYRVAVAVADTTAPRSVLAATAEAVSAVIASRVEAGTPPAEALKAAADSLDAPVGARAVRSFSRARRKDIPVPTEDTGVVPAALRAAGTTDQGRYAVHWTSVDGSQTVSPPSWSAYERADGAVYYLPRASGAVALTDGTLAGWAFQDRRAYLVDAARVGRLLALLPVAASGK